MKAVILCGGKGTRLYPLTESVQKCMLPIKGKPVLEYQLEFFKSQGITDIILAVGHLSEGIINYFGDGSKFGVNITYSFDNGLGTGGAIKSCNLKERFVVLNGDTLLNVDLKDLLANHIKPITVVIAEKINPDRYGVLVKGKFKEKVNVEKGFVSCGLYIIEPEILEYIPSNTYCSLENEIFPNFHKIDYYIYEDKWIDMGIHETYQELR